MGLKSKIITGLVLAGIIGTVGGSEGGVPPIYTKKVGTSYGINISLITEIRPEAKHYGINLSVITKNLGTVNGINAGLVNLSGEEEYKASGGRVNGLEVGLINSCLTSGTPTKINGLQMGVSSYARGKVVQIGVMNSNQSANREKERITLGVNWRFD